MNISSCLRLILTISVSGRLPSATETGHFVGFIAIWWLKNTADSPQITGCLFQENKQSFSFFLFFQEPCRQLWCPPELQGFSLLIGEVEQRGETLTSPASAPRFAAKPEHGAVWLDQGQVSAGEVGRRSGGMWMEIKRFIIKYSWMAVHPCSCYTPVANWQLHLRLTEHEGGNDGESDQERKKILNVS